MNKIIDYKSDNYHKERHPEFLSSDELNLVWSEFAFHQYFNALQSHLTILEFGGGLGYNLIFANKFYDCHMIEPAEIGRKSAEKYGIKSYNDISDLLQNTKAKFDKILCRHVLEHLDNPLDTLSKLKELLKEDGELILILPYEKEIKPIKKEIDFHLYCWTPRTAYNLLKVSGFNNLEYKYNYFTGKSILLPIYKNLGFGVYSLIMKILGRIFNAKELQLNAKIR